MAVLPPGNDMQTRPYTYRVMLSLASFLVFIILCFTLFLALVSNVDYSYKSFPPDIRAIDYGHYLHPYGGVALFLFFGAGLSLPTMIFFSPNEWLWRIRWPLYWLILIEVFCAATLGAMFVLTHPGEPIRGHLYVADVQRDLSMVGKLYLRPLLPWLEARVGIIAVVIYAAIWSSITIAIVRACNWIRQKYAIPGTQSTL